jgi:hypothetical protein
MSEDGLLLYGRSVAKVSGEADGGGAAAQVLRPLPGWGRNGVTSTELVSW